MNEQHFKDNLKLHFLVLIWGFTAILGKLISIPSVEIVFYRTLLSAIGLGLLLVWKRHRFGLRWQENLRILGIGALIGVHWVLFFASAKVSNVSVCLVGMATTSLWTSMVEPLFNRRRLRKHELFLGSAVLVGLYIVFRAELSDQYILGLLLAVVSALLAALFSVLNAKITSQYNHHFITFWEMVGAFLIVVVFMPIYGLFFTGGVIQLIPQSIDWFYLILLAWGCTVFPWSAMIEMLRRMTAFAVNMTINLEPVYGIALAFIIFGESEKMNLGFYLGTAIILAAVFIYPVYSRRKAKNAI
ncbi:MAG: DMT family transporter [Cyclobacteriaceae bacterium]|nr:DMT family transporter [Cyclobacteriaceae bacterium]